MFSPSGYCPLVVALTASALAACGSATVGAVGMPPATAKWVGPAVPSPNGGRVTTTIYYGPWQCNAKQMGRCQRQCTSEGRMLMGCIWLADIKGDWVGRFMFLPAEGGTRYPLTHCCCDYATVAPRRGRGIWDNARDAFRTNWIEEFGAWPSTAGRNWPGHHIRDLGHGGHPTDSSNILPVPDPVHTLFNNAYPQCYARGSRWSTPGPNLPYSD
ncbi:hypothetical protein SAMN05444354_1055 [Stigmatella aurantiaca]|uniref:Lipoprotein n=2 Tax=Stigmatella aurantiaca TaxID=41 RepID=A0A1H7NM85_STIAU|nr:hypothetical protein SAMN05444354_1055 [Stigmatella aurantiaca]